jgi:AcrR family transcriptional regulator
VKVGLVSEQVNAPSGDRRRYDNSTRRGAAAANRQRILVAARELFLARGYRATTVAAIGRRAAVSSDTVNAAVGRKPELFRELVETALSGGPSPVPGRDRDYAVTMRAAPTLAAKLAVYAAAVTAIQARLAPLFLVLREAAAGEEDLAVLWREVSERRARNMRELAGDLATTGTLRADLSLEDVADVIWSMNSSEYYALLVLDRGWTPDRFRTWLIDAWLRLLTG